MGKFYAQRLSPLRPASRAPSEPIHDAKTNEQVWLHLHLRANVVGTNIQFGSPSHGAEPGS